MDEFREAQAELGHGGAVGWYDRVLPNLDERQREALAAAAADPTISHRAIATVIGRWGWKVTAGQVGHWRRTYVAR